MVASKTVISYVLLAVGVCVLAYFVTTVEIGLVVSSLRQAGALPLSGAVAASLLNIGIKAWRWQWIISRVSSVRIPAHVAVGSVYAGVASASLVPGRVVDFAKPLIAKGSYGVPMTRSTTALILERVADSLSVALLFVLSILFVPQIRGTAVHTVVLPVAGVFALIILLAALFRERASALLKGLLSKLPQEKRFVAAVGRVVYGSLDSIAACADRSGLAVLFAFSAAAMLLEVVRFYLVFLSTGIHIDLFAVMLLYTASILVSFVSFVPGGIGIIEAFQAASLVLLLPGESAREVAKGAILIDRVISYYAVAAIGAVFLVLYQRSYSATRGSGE